MMARRPSELRKYRRTRPRTSSARSLSVPRRDSSRCNVRSGGHPEEYGWPRIASSETRRGTLRGALLFLRFTGTHQRGRFAFRRIVALGVVGFLLFFCRLHAAGGRHLGFHRLLRLFL